MSINTVITSDTLFDCIIFPLHEQDNMLMGGLYEVYYVDLLLLFHRQNLIFRVTCSKGTYIRSLCADLGKALGRYHLQLQLKFGWVLGYYVMQVLEIHSPFLVFDMIWLGYSCAHLTALRRDSIGKVFYYDWISCLARAFALFIFHFSHK